MKISTLDRAALQNLRAPLEAELKAFGERLGLELTLGNGSYGDGVEASFKLILRVDDPATKLAATKAEWDRNCGFIGIDYSKPDATGLRPDDFGAEFRSGLTTYRVVGLHLKGKNSQKFPIKVEILSDPSNRRKAGEVVLLTDQVVPAIRAATDAAKSKEAVAA